MTLIRISSSELPSSSSPSLILIDRILLISTCQLGFGRLGGLLGGLTQHFCRHRGEDQPPRRDHQVKGLKGEQALATLQVWDNAEDGLGRGVCRRLRVYRRLVR
ncbi:MAG: hypothetical protein Q8P31_05620 [Bacillota bacterium]|nr:hypothetical protein [Bacillota bacterium]